MFVRRIGYFFLWLLQWTLSSAIQAQSHSEPDIIEFVTDFEGQRGSFDDFFSRSRIFSKDHAGELIMLPNSHFIYGGDAVDRGESSLEILHTLIKLKQRFPDQVTLLLGNRDINKMRFLNALPVEGFLKAETELPEFVRTGLSKMNAGDAFEFRRSELSRRAGGGAMSDLSVAQSFIHDVSEGGPMREYYRLAQIGLRLGRNLFFHGASRSEAFGTVPNDSTTYPNIDEWVTALNRFAQTEIANFIDRRGSLGSQLQLYQRALPETPGRNDTSVIYGRHESDALGNMLEPSAALTSLYTNQGVARLVGGHTPQGELPSYLRYHGLEIIVADTSAAEKRSVSILRLQGARTSIDSILPSGERLISETEIGAESPIGKLTGDSYQILGRQSDGQWILKRAVKKHSPQLFLAPNLGTCDRSLLPAIP